MIAEHVWSSEGDVDMPGLCEARSRVARLL